MELKQNVSGHEVHLLVPSQYVRAILETK